MARLVLAAAEAGLGNNRGAVESYGRALEIWQRQDQTDRQALIFNRIGAIYASIGEHKRTIELHTRALALAQSSKNVPLAAATRASLGRAHFECKQWDAAKPHFDEALRLFHQCGDKRGYAMALFHLGKLNLAAGHDMLRSAATMFRELGDTASEHAALDLLPVDPAVDNVQKKQA